MPVRHTYARAYTAASRECISTNMIDLRVLSPCGASCSPHTFTADPTTLDWSNIFKAVPLELHKGFRARAEKQLAQMSPTDRIRFLTLAPNDVACLSRTSNDHVFAPKTATLHDWYRSANEYVVKTMEVPGEENVEDIFGDMCHVDTGDLDNAGWVKHTTCDVDCVPGCSFPCIKTSQTSKSNTFALHLELLQLISSILPWCYYTPQDIHVSQYFIGCPHTV